MQVRYALVMCIILSLMGCAQPQQTKDHLQNHHSDFKSGINVITDYITNEDRTFVIIEVDNREAKQISIWMEQSHSAPGKRSINQSRFYQGSDKIISQTFRLPRVGEGITEAITFEVFAINGTSLFRTQPITFTPEVK